MFITDNVNKIISFKIVQKNWFLNDFFKLINYKLYDENDLEFVCLFCLVFRFNYL